MIGRGGRILALLIAGLLLAGLGSVAWLAGTESGTRWLLRQSLHLVPGETDFATSDGTLLTRLDISGIRHEGGYGQTRLEELSVEPDLAALLRGVVVVEQLRGRGLSVELPDEGPAPAKGPAAPGGGDRPVLALPLELVLEDVAIRDIRIRTGDTGHHVTRLATAGHWRGRVLDLNYLALQQQQRHVTVSGEVIFGQPWKLDTRIAWGMPLPRALAPWFQPQTAFGEARLRGRLSNLKLDHQLYRPQELHSRGRIQPLQQPLHLDLTHDWPRLALTLPDGRRLELAEGRLETRGTLDDYELMLEAGPTELEGMPTLRPRLRARGDRQSLDIERLLLAGNPGRLEISGAVNWRKQPSWRLSLEGEELDPAWLDERVPGRLSLQARLNGRLPRHDPLALDIELERLEGRVRGEPVQASGRATMTGTDSVDISSLELNTDHGRALVSGTAAWAPHPRWRLAVEGRGWDPAGLDQRLPGRIRLEGRVDGELAPGTPARLAVQIDQLGGTLRDQALDGSARVSLHGRDRIRGQAELQLGANEVSLDGHREDDTALNLAVDAPDLAPLWPGLAGSLQGRVRMRGALATPELEGELRGRNLRLSDWDLASLDLTLTPPTADTRQNLVLNARSLARKGQLQARSLALSLRGGASEHRLDWSLKRAEHRLGATLSGGLKDQVWTGELRNLQLLGPLSGTWRQARAVTLTAGPEQLGLEPICVHAEAGPGRICTRARWSERDQGKGSLALTDVPLAPFNTFLPDRAGLEGDLNGEASLRSQAGQWSGRAELSTDGGALLLSGERPEPVRIPWQQLSARARLDAGDWRLATRLKREGGDFIRGHVAGQPEDSVTRLDGRLETRLDDLKWLELLVSRLRSPKGSLEGQLALSGTMAQPVFDGGLALRDGQVRVPRAGIILRDIGVNANTDERGRLLFDGQARSGEGRVTLSGELATDESWPWPLQMQLKGSDFVALDRPNTRFVLDPDLKLTLAGQRLKLGGRVGVPAARITPLEMDNGGVRVSPDAQRVGAEGRDPRTWQTDINVAVELGEDVRFSGFGLTAGFDGAVRYLDPFEKPPRMTGEMRIRDGRYRAWGQKLDIERGRLLFEGAPDNPGLDIIAVRPLPGREIRVGLEVTGTLQQPNARVFSEPPREQSEAMALLLTGRPLSGTSRAESDAILQALTRYGLEKGDFLTNPLSESLGVDIGVASTNEQDQTALTLGKRLSDRLYVQYSMGLFESLSTVMLRYSITRRLSLETRSSGEAQGADLIYRLQRD